MYVSVFNHFDCHAADNENVNYILVIFHTEKQLFFPQEGNPRFQRGEMGREEAA